MSDSTRCRQTRCYMSNRSSQDICIWITQISPNAYPRYLTNHRNYQRTIYQQQAMKHYKSLLRKTSSPQRSYEHHHRQKNCTTQTRVYARLSKRIPRRTRWYKIISNVYYSSDPQKPPESDQVSASIVLLQLKVKNSKELQYDHDVYDLKAVVTKDI